MCSTSPYTWFCAAFHVQCLMFGVLWSNMRWRFHECKWNSRGPCKVTKDDMRMVEFIKEAPFVMGSSKSKNVAMWTYKVHTCPPPTPALSWTHWAHLGRKYFFYSGNPLNFLLKVCLAPHHLILPVTGHSDIPIRALEGVDSDCGTPVFVSICIHIVNIAYIHFSMPTLSLYTL